MGTDYTGGGFDDLRRETEKMKADAARLRNVTNAAAAQTETDERARRNLASRARAATTRNLATAETLVARAGDAAGTTTRTAATNAERIAQASSKTAQTERQVAAARKTSSAALAADAALLRRYGPYAGGRHLEAQGRSPAQMAALTGAGMARTSASRLQLPARAESLVARELAASERAAAEASARKARFDAISAREMERQRAAAMSTANVQRTQAGRIATAMRLPPATTPGVPMYDIGGGGGRVPPILPPAPPTPPPPPGGGGPPRVPGGPGTPTPAQMGAYSAGISRAATSHMVLNAQMERHGALSSEFIQQLARGNVGIREFGSQLVTTAGKFGGWLAAGAGIFALLGIIGNVASGAMDAADGVNQLRRVVNDVDPGEATQGFRDLSDEMNLPISEVAGAQYEMGKVFNDQTESLEAARIVLAAVKVGELDVATASRYLTAITKGFNLEASQMTDVFGQVNAAQNDFGLNIEDTLAGMSSAAGAAKTLGGSTEDVLAFFTAARQAAGVSGNVTGTAVQRMTTFLQQNKESLKGFGIDVDTMDLDEIFAKAYEIAPTLDRQSLIELSKSLGGSFYGPRVFLPALGEAGQKAYKDSLDTYGEAGEATWVKELDTALQSPRETILKMAMELQQFGSSLSDSGAFTGIFLIVKALATAMDIVGDIYNLFNSLPKPLRTVLMLLAQMYGLFRLMRRFNIGSTLPGRAGQALTNPRNPINDQREALVVRRTELSNQLVNASAAVTRAEIAHTVARQQLLAEAKKQGVIATEQGRTVVAQKNTMAGTVDVYDALEGHRQAIFDATVEESVIAKEQRDTMRKEAALSKQSTTFRRQVGPAGTPGAGGGGADVTAYMKRVEGLGPAARNLAMAREAIVNNIRQSGPTMGVLQSMGQAISAGASRLRTSAQRMSLRGAFARMRGAASSMAASARGMMAMLTPLDVALMAIGAIAFFIASARAKAVEMERTTEQIKGAESLDAVESSFAAVEDQIANENLGDDIADLLGSDARARQEEAIKAYEDRIADYNNFKSAINRAGSGPISPEERADISDSDVTEDMYEEMAQDIATRIDKHLISREQGEAMLDELIKGAWDNTGIEDPQGLEDAMRSTALGEGVQRDVDMIRKRAELAAARGPLYDELGAAEDAVATARKVLQATREGGDEGEILDAQVELANAERTLKETQHERAQALLDAAGQLAVSEIDPDRTVARARQETQNAKNALSLAREQGRPADEIKQLQAALNDAEWAQQQAIEDRVLALIQSGSALAQSRLNPANIVGRAREALSAAQDTLRELRANDATRQQIEEAMAAVNDAEWALQEAIRERASAMIDLISRQRVANAPLYAPMVSETTALWAAQRQLALAIRTNAGAQAIKEAHVAVDEAERALALAANDRARALMEVQGEISLTRIDPENTVGIAQQALTNAQNIYNLLLAQGRDAEELLPALLAIRQAEVALQQAIEARAEAIAQARFDIAAAKAEASGNEIRQAAIAIRDALYDLAHADTREESLAARAALIRARTAKRDAIFQTEIEDIEFQADIGKLTIQQQIRAYEHMLKTMELNRDMRRDLRRRIYQLKHESENAAGEFDLKVGDIRLPTIYEIRRAMQGGVNQQSNVNFVQNNNFTAQGDGANEAVQKMNDQMAGAGSRARNMMRSAGIG